MASLTQDDVFFQNITVADETTGEFLASTQGKISRDNEAKIAAGKGKPVVNAVSIDWNGAYFKNIPVPAAPPSIINTTVDLLKTIKYASGNNNLTGSFGQQIALVNSTYTTPIVTGFVVKNGKITNVYTSTLGDLKEAISNVTPESDPDTPTGNTYYEEVVTLDDRNGNTYKITLADQDKTYTIYGEALFSASSQKYSKDGKTDGNPVDITGNITFEDGKGGTTNKDNLFKIEYDAGGVGYAIKYTGNYSEGSTIAQIRVPHTAPGNDSVWHFYVDVKQLSTQVPQASVSPDQLNN